MAPVRKKGSKKASAKGASGRTRGDGGVSVTSESDVTSENPNSSEGDEVSEGDKNREPATSSARNVDGDVDPIELTEEWKELEGMSLVDDLRGGVQNSFKYITDTPEHRMFELNARKRLLELHREVENLHSAMSSSLKTTLQLCPKVENGKVSELIASLKPTPRTFKDLLAQVLSLPDPFPRFPTIKIDEPIFEDSGEEEETDNVAALPLPIKPGMFPSPAKMAKFLTPKNKQVFHFGKSTKTMSTSKAPRLAKPGEIVFSSSGSPILQRRIIDNQKSSKEAAASERVEVVQPDGSKIEVDIVYRHVNKGDSKNVRGFKEFAKEVRGIAASRATTVRQNRVMPPKILKAQSASASKAKPDWR